MKQYKICKDVRRNLWALITIAVAATIISAMYVYKAPETVWVPAIVGLLGIIFLGIQHDFRKNVLFHPINIFLP